MENLVTTQPTILVLGDGDVSTEVANWIAEHSSTEVAVIHASNTISNKLQPVPHPNVRYLAAIDRRNASAMALMLARPSNFLITCYWPWILEKQAFEKYAGNTINFHPSLLPRDKGWYPHVHQICEGRSGGVTLHQLSSIVDGGDIWVQSEVPLPFPLTAEDARNILKAEILDLFRVNWESIFHGRLTPLSQEGTGNYLSKSAVNDLDFLAREDRMLVEDVVRRIACRNSGNKSFVAIQGDDGPKFVHIKFSNSGNLGFE